MTYHDRPAIFKREIIEKILQDYFKTAVNDPMIGYMFTGKDIARLIQKEVELTLRFFDEETKYTGRNLREAHRALKVKTGEFNRRMVLLKQAMEKNNLPTELIARWIEHNEQAREIVTNAKLDC